MFANQKDKNGMRSGKSASESPIVETIFCPNCGKEAHNYHILAEEIVRTSCRSCDYLMIKCARTGNVIEAYAPGIIVSQS
jgi:ribosomal protein S27AE